MADVVKDAQQLYQDAIDALQDQRRQIGEDLEFSDPSDPQQWDKDIRRQRENDPGGARPCLVFDQCGQYVSNVSGQIEKQPPSLHAIPVGGGADKRAAAFEAAHDDYSAIMLKSLADRLAEAFAEWLHREVRMKHWGYAADETLDNAALIKEAYQGIRPAPGYPACPDHLAKRGLFDLLDVPKLAGMTLTESCAMWPAASVSGFYLAHPAARYFAVGKIGTDQLEDWARRCGLSVSEAQRWLAPNL